MFSGKNLAIALEENATRRGSHPAIVDGSRTITYGEFDLLVRRTAGHLANYGVSSGSIVGVCLRDSANHLAVLFAVARLGAIILPMDWRWTGPEKVHVAQHFNVSLIVVEFKDELPDFRCLAIDNDWSAQVERCSPNVPLASGGSAPVVLSLSSGTTGRPKGPALTHDQFIARFIIQWVTLGFNQHDRYLSATPIYFGGGRSFTMGSLFSGGTVIMFPPPYEPEELVAAVKKYEATTLLLVPTLLRRLLELPVASTPLLAGLNRLLSTGAILHPDERRTVMDRLNPNFINYYGSTEGGGISVLLPKHTGTAATSVGEPIYQTEVEIVDDNEGQLPIGEVGQIRYRGPAVAVKYYNDAEATAAAYKDGWFYPGDMGRRDGDGLLYLAGRAKDIIIRGGVNIYPAEIEQVLLSHPAITEAVAIARPDRDLGEDIAVFAVTNGTVEESKILKHCRNYLAPYKVPKEIFFVDDMPKTALGKIMKAELAARLAEAE